MTEAEQLRSLLQPGMTAATASARRVVPVDLPEGGLEQLADMTLAYLRTRPSTPSAAMPGWSRVAARSAGVLPWWAEALGIVDDEPQRVRLRTLRMNVYDLLDAQQVVVKLPGQGEPVHVSPAGAEVHELPREGRAADAGAGRGTAEVNALVEQAAVSEVVRFFGSDDWEPDDVSAAKVGWDVTFRRGTQELHVEIKGCSGLRPSFTLTANEHRKAMSDDRWLCAVVTAALIEPAVHLFDRRQVVQAAVPEAYRVDLAGRSEFDLTTVHP